MMKKKILTLLLPAAFVIYIGVMFILNIGNFKDSAVSSAYHLLITKTVTPSAAASEFEGNANSNFYHHLRQVDVNGLFQKLCGRKMVNNTVLGDHNKLYNGEHVDWVYDKKEVDRSIDYIEAIFNEAGSNGATVLYVQHPEKFNGNEDSLPYGLDYDYWQNANHYVERLTADGHPTLDLRNYEDACVFFKNDHHWTIQSAFNGSKHIAETLDSMIGLNDVDKITDISNYDIETYKKSFFGSVGVRVGRWFMGRDDFDVITPKFETEIDYSRFAQDSQLVEQHSGNFSEALIDYDLLNDKDYMNKYNSYDRDGYIENHIVNKTSPNPQKVLLISDSYSRPMQTFLSLNFYETRTLDPQEGRYNHSYLQYIREYKPDIVVVMYPYGFTDATMAEDGM